MGKKGLFVTVSFLALVVLTANAQQGGFSGQGGFRGQVTTVEQARRLRDDTPVILQGRIGRFLREEYYEFSDDTGSIIIEIDHRVWGELSVNEDDLVEIVGEIDRFLFFRPKVEVRSIRKL